ncbi:MAG TPA: RHS repeat-associated core domain-containing protein [Saprospiraceae bacterium]|nr:RHS repeat-associated core domain-containing protein [Saprospiraceae bacterium]
MLAEQKAGGYSTKYRFTGKELDEESGLYYFGARYYDPRISLWYGVDPLAEKYPSWNPYRYGFNNPIRIIDPTGMSEEDSDGGGDPKKKAPETSTCPPSSCTPTPTPQPSDKPKEDTYSYPEGFVGNVNRVINNIFDNKPSDEVKLKEPDGFKFALKKTLSVNLQMANIASTVTGVGLAAKGIQGAKIAIAGIEALNFGFSAADIYNDATNKESKLVDYGSAIFGLRGINTSLNQINLKTINSEKSLIQLNSNISDLFDIQNLFKN